MFNKSLFQLVLTSFSFEPEIDLKALVQCFLPLVQDLIYRFLTGAAIMQSLAEIKQQLERAKPMI